MTTTGFQSSCVTLASFDSDGVKYEPGSTAGLIDPCCAPPAILNAGRRFIRQGWGGGGQFGPMRDVLSQPTAVYTLPANLIPSQFY